MYKQTLQKSDIQDSDFFVLSEKNLNQFEEKILQFKSNDYYFSFPDKKFITNHDIFHFAFERGLIHEVYELKTQQKLNKTSSYTFHGEGFIELCSRFFGNLDQDLFTISDDNSFFPRGDYLRLPKHQHGVRKEQPHRIFPVLLELNAKNLLIYNQNKSHNVVLNYIRYVIIGSLVTGSIVDKFIEELSSSCRSTLEWTTRKYFYSQEFKEIVEKFIVNRETHPLLEDLNIFLKTHYDTSLEKTIEYCQLWLCVFYDVFLNLKIDKLYQTEDCYLFPTCDSTGSVTLLTQLFLLNRTANLVYKNPFKSDIIFFGFCLLP